MLSACRRAPASISRVARAVTSAPIAFATTRPSTFLLAAQNVSRPLAITRCFSEYVEKRPWGYSLARSQDQQQDRQQGRRGGWQQGQGQQRGRRFKPVEDQLEPVEQDPSTLITRYQDLADRELVHPGIIEAITKDMGYETMTDVQSKTISQTLKGVDV